MHKLKLDRTRPALEIYYDNSDEPTDSNHKNSELYIPFKCSLGTGRGSKTCAVPVQDYRRMMRSEMKAKKMAGRETSHNVVIDNYNQRRTS
jgi:hypothetical protein